VAIHPDGWLLSGFIVYALTVTGTSAIATYLNGSDYIRGQALLVAAHALVSIALKLLFCRYLGIAGVIWGTNISYFVVIIPAYFLIVPRLLVQQARPEGADPRSLVDGMAPV
jgi:O-antigen/teichoic acid export membrane protein